MRSSFYLVAKGVKPRHDAAVQAVERWKAQWKILTFGTEVIKETEWGLLGRTEDMEVEVVFKEFGSELLRLVEPVLAVQKEALENAPWMKKVRAKTDGKIVSGDKMPAVE